MKPLLLIPGWAMTSKAWSEFIEHARAWSRTRSVEWWECLRDNRAVLDAAAHLSGRPVLVGWSLGGLLALEAALANPGAFGALVLVSTSACFTSPPPSGAGSFGNIIRAMRAKVRKERETVLWEFFGLLQAITDELPDLTSHLQEALNIEPAALAEGLKYLTEKDFRTGLKDITLPTLVVHGRDDRIVPPEAGHWLAQQMPNARFFCQPDCGHALPVVAPRMLAQLIRDFLNAEVDKQKQSA